MFFDPSHRAGVEAGQISFDPLSFGHLTGLLCRLKQLLVAAEVKNSAHAATITGTVNAVDRELLNVINAI